MLTYCTEFPRAWILAEAQQITEDDDSDREEEDAEPSQSPTYAAFLQFLSLGCNGSAARGYPTILVILNTIPNDMLGDGSAFFAALWSAVDGRALGTPDAARAFLACVVECALWAVKRGRASLAPEQFSRAWDALLSKDLKGATTAVVADGLEKLARMDDGQYVFCSLYLSLTHIGMQLCFKQLGRPSRPACQINLRHLRTPQPTRLT